MSDNEVHKYIASTPTQRTKNVSTSFAAPFLFFAVSSLLLFVFFDFFDKT